MDAPASPTVPGSQSVQVSIKNHGINNLNSVRVNWSVDGVTQTSHSWTGSLASGAVAAAVNIGSYNFTLGNPTLKIWTNNPNGNADNYTSNDTLEVSLLVCTSLSGAYTLGGASSNFPSFNSLAIFLHNCGVSGAVIIKVAPGTYREQFTLGNIAGVSQSNTIVIDGGDSSLVRLTHDGSTSNATVSFDSTSYVTLRNMTLENTKSSTGAWIVHLQNTDHIVIDSCLIEQPVNVTSNRGGIVGSGSLNSSSTATTNKHLTVSDNIITGGYYGIDLRGSTSDEDVGNHVLRNRFSNIERRAIQVRKQDSLMISGNVIENINASSTSGMCMYCEDITDFEITANNLLDCGDRGIVIYKAGSSGTARSLIANNMIYTPKDVGIRMRGLSSGLSNSKVNVYHNTTVGDPAMQFTSGGNSNMSIYNNIFSNPNGVALEASSSLPSTIKIDYNLYQASGNIAKDGFTSYANLAAWQAAKPALNRNSVEGNPLFVSATSPADLHLAGTLANDTGDNSVGIKVDIDGDSRPLPPSTRVDMGADEYHPPTCLPSSRLSASVRSGSAASLSWTASGALNWNIEYGPPGFIPGSGTFVYNVLNPHILTGLNPSTNYDFYVQDSCGVGDVSVWTGPFTFQTACVNALSGTYTLGRASSDFPDFDSLATFLNNCGILGPVIIKVASGTYRESFTLGSITGVSQSNTIVIDGGSSSLARLIQDGSTSNATVAFDSTSYVSLRNITLENIKSSANTWVVHLQNTDHIVIDSCLIEMSVNTTSERGGIVGSDGLRNSYTATTNNHLTISNNTITGGYYGISLRGNASDEDVGNYILRNRFIDIYNYGILIDEQDSLIISGNVIENTNSSYAYDIYCLDITDFEIRANNLLDCGDEGIVIKGGTSSGTARSLIANNMIYAPNAAIRMTGYSPFFLSKINIYHNTAVGDPAMEFIGSNYSDMSFYNNIFSNPNGVALKAFSGLPSTIDIDYNLYQASGNIAEDGSTSYTNLAAWQAAKPALNQNSVEGNPLFVRATSPADLHLIGTLANDTGDNSVGIKVDIDGDSRPLPPSTRVDMGADEYHLPTCLPSSRLSASVTGASAASLSWTTGGALNWNIEYGPPGFIPGSGTFVYNVLNPYILTGLNPHTNYDFYVQDSCGIGDVSIWRGPFSFATLCPSLSAATLPLIEDFESLSGTFQRDTGVFCSSTYAWSYETSFANDGRLRFAVSGFANNGSSAATLDGLLPRWLVGSTVTNYLILTTDLSRYSSSSALELEFSYMHHGEENHPNDRVWIRGGNTNSWVQIYDLYTNQGTAGIYNLVTGLDIDSILANATPPQRVSSTFQVRFGQEDADPATSRTGSDGYSFDDIAIRETCPGLTKLTATQITQTSATLSWVAGGASNWDLEYGLSGFTLGSGTQIHTTIPSYTVSGLTLGMGYDFYVRSTCGLGHASSWAGPHTFTTLSTSLPCPSPSSLLATNITQTTAALSWVTGGASNWNMEYGIQGFTPGSGTFVYNVPNPYILTGLNPSTNYDFYVQDSCGVGDVSLWTGPFTFQTTCVALSGTYTLGRASSDFPDFDSLATFLNNCGILGPVIIKVASGTYREQFTLGNIAGVSPTNTIVIDGGSSSLVTLTHDGSTSNATVAFDSTSYVSLRNMTIENTKSSIAAWVVHLQNTDHIVIDSCLIEMSVNTTAERGGIVGSGSLSDSYTATTNNHLTISNNIITGGSYGIALEGNTSNEDVGNRILRNRFSDIGDVGIYMSNADSLMISGNVIENTHSSYASDIYCVDITDFEIRANNLLDCGDEGIVIDGGSSSGTARSLIANNMIYAPNTAISMWGNNSNVNIYHNTAVGDPAMFIGGNLSDMSLYNNIFSNPNGVALSGLLSNIDIDYNLYQYQASGNIAKDGFTIYATLAAWQAAKPALNAHSVEGDPLFVRATSPVDLHLIGTLANDTGDNSVGIKVDIDGDSRPLPPSTRVDIGADEYHLSTCLSSSRLSASVMGASAASLSWTTGGALNWNIEYGPPGFIPGSGTFVYNVLNPYILTGLNPSTNYNFYVQDSCGVGDVSVWSGPFSFITPCSLSPATLPLMEDFESLSGTFQRDTVVFCVPTYNWRYETSLANDGRLRFAVSGFANNGNSAATLDRALSGGGRVTNYLILTADLSNYSSSSALELEFSYMHHREENHPNDRVWIRGSNTDAWVQIYDLYANQNIAGIYNWVIGLDIDTILANATPPQRVSSTFQLRFGQEGYYWTQSTTANDGYSFDDITIREVWCRRSSSLTVNTIGLDTASVSWTGGGGGNVWIIEWGIAGFTQGSGTLDTITTNSYTLKGLTPFTTYDFYVRDSCSRSGNSLSLWSFPISFKTLCPSLSPATLPLIEDFESLSGTFQRDAPVLCAPTYNWSYETSLANDGRLRFAVSSFANNGSSAATLDKSIFTSSLVTNYLIMTADLSNYNSSSALELEFSYMHHGEENHANDRVWIRGSNTDAWVQIYDLYANQNIAGIYNWVIGLDIDAILANATPPQRVSSTFQVRFGQEDDFPAASRTTSDGYSFDDIAIRETCPSPTKLTATNITQTSATLSWVAGGASNWDLEYGLSGFTLGRGTQIHTTIPSYTVSGLTLGMGYDFYVRSSCGLSHASSWSGPDAFTTLSATLPCPSPSLLGTSNITQTSARLSWVTGGASNWNMEYGIQGFTPGSGTFVYNVPNPYTLSGLTPGTDYDFYVRDSCGAGHVSSWSGPDAFTTLSATLPCPSPSLLGTSNITQTSARLSWVTGGASNWNMEYGIQGFTPGSGTFVYNVPNPYTLSGLTPGTDYDFYVRDSCGAGHVSSWSGPDAFITLSATLPCPAPSSLGATQITQTTAALSWVTGGASNWNMEYGIQGFTPGSGTFVYNVPNPYTLSGLTPGTDYDFYFRDSCGVGHVSSWAGPHTFTTLSATLPCPSPSSLGATQITQTTAALSWVTGGASNWNMEYGIQGFTPGSGTFVYNVPNPYTLSGLTPGTDYDFYVRDSCGAGHVSSWAGPDAFTTLSATLPCPSPSLLGTSNITQTSARLSWVTGGASNWNMEYGIQGFTPGSGTFVYNVPNPYTLSGLTPGTDYDFYVRDSCGAGHVSSWAGPDTFRTLGCLAPTGLKLDIITEITATVSWTSGGASNWNIEYGPINFPLGGGIFLYNVSSPRTLRGLKPNTFYDVYVQDSCNVGNLSNWTGPLSIKTIIGIDELLERSFRIYPNPSEGVFKLEFSSSLGEDMEIRITNMMGQIVLEDEIESFSGSYRKRLEMGAYRSGVYLLQLITERATVNRRIILQ